MASRSNSPVMQTDPQTPYHFRPAPELRDPSPVGSSPLPCPGCSPPPPFGPVSPVPRFIPCPPPARIDSDLKGYHDENEPEPSCMFRTGVVIWLCSLLIVAGLLGITGAAIGLHSFANLAESGAGIWCGLMFIAAGAVGIAASQSMTVPLVKATVAMAAIAVVLAIVLLIIGVVGLVGEFTNDDLPEGKCWALCRKKPHWVCYDARKKAVAANVVLIIAALLALFCALWLLIISARSLRQYFDYKELGMQPELQEVGGDCPCAPGAGGRPNQINPVLPPGVLSLRPNQPIIILRQQEQPIASLHHPLPDGTIALHPDQPIVALHQPAKPVTISHR